MDSIGHFGLHFTESGVGLLVQNEVQHALGVDLTFNVKVRPPRRSMTCPHRIDLQGAENHTLPDDPLVDIMLPLPKPEGSEATLMEDTPKNEELLRLMLRFSSPDGVAPTVPLWLYKPETLAEMLRLTNVMPLIITGYQQTHHLRLRKVIEASRHLPRRLVVLMPRLPLFTTGRGMETRLSPTDFDGLPLERIGAARLIERMLSQGN